jgi:ribosomal protein L16 Arg81 hydroxylase
VARLVQNTRLLFNCEASVNAYLTPAHAQAFHAHFDTADVVILQTHGEKLWRPHGAWADLPVRRSPAVPSPEGVAEQVVLWPGDLLYLPRGFAHEPSTDAAASLHLTLGLYLYRWKDLIADLCEHVVDHERVLRQRVRYGPHGAPADAAELKQGFAQAMHSLDKPGVLDAVLQAHRRRFLEASTVAGHF